MKAYTTDDWFVSPQFPRSSRYHPEWITASVSGGANPLWLTEWLAGALDNTPKGPCSAPIEAGHKNVAPLR